MSDQHIPEIVVAERRPGHAAFIGWSLVLTLFVYLGFGHILHQLIFPLAPPDPATYPRAGDELVSLSEGVRQRVLAVSDGWIESELELLPGAAGPPMHYHRAFAETFSVTRGTLYLELPDGVVQVGPGERYQVAAGVPHRPFNPLDEPVTVRDGDGAQSIPLSFAACLVQLYSLMDERGGEGPWMLLQMAVLDPICDSHLGAVPGPVMTLGRILLAPAARLAGYRNYYPERSLHPG